VFLVNGNKVDIISDWHIFPSKFDAVVRRVADAAYKGELALVVPS
jgi:hypothetical protein